MFLEGGDGAEPLSVSRQLITRLGAATEKDLIVAMVGRLPVVKLLLSIFSLSL